MKEKFGVSKGNFEREAWRMLEVFNRFESDVKEI
jgi:hypothetical protein